MSTGTGQSPAWLESLQISYTAIIEHIGAILPELSGGLALLLLGWLLAHGLRIGVDRGLNGLEAMIRRVTGAQDQGRTRHMALLPGTISRLVFWFVLIVFILAAANFAGLRLSVTGWLAHLPNIAAAFFIILTAIIAGSVSRKLTEGVLTPTSTSHTGIIAFSVQLFIVLSGIIIGLEQTGIDLTFLTTLLAVIVGVVLAGACLAFGLGAQTLIADMIGTRQAARYLQPGQEVELAGNRGTVLEIGQTTLVLETETGRSLIPGRYFQNGVTQHIDKGGQDYGAS